MLWLNFSQIEQYIWLILLRLFFADSSMWSIIVLQRSSFLGRPFFAAADHIGQYHNSSSWACIFLIAFMEMSLLIVASIGSWLHHCAVVHHRGIVFTLVNPSIMFSFATTTMWQHGISSVAGTPHMQDPKYDPRVFSLCINTTYCFAFAIVLLTFATWPLSLPLPQGGNLLRYSLCGGTFRTNHDNW